MTTESKGLDAIVDRVITFARERNIALIPGFAPEQEASVPRIQYTASRLPDGVDGDTARTFIEALERLEVALIAIQILEFHEKRWRSAIELLQSGIRLYRDRGHQAARAGLEGVLAEAKSARRYLGSTASVGVTVITRNPTMLIEWLEMTDWHRSIADAEDAILAEVEYDEPPDDDEGGSVGSDEPFPPPPSGGRRARRTH